MTSPKKQANSGRLRRTAAQNLSFLGFRDSSPNLVGFFSSVNTACSTGSFGCFVKKAKYRKGNNLTLYNVIDDMQSFCVIVNYSQAISHSDFKNEIFLVVTFLQ
jgi:hypothetical protein